MFIEDVQPSTAYQLKIRARTSTGDVTVEYDLVTLDHAGLTPSPDRINRAGRQLVTNANSDSGHVVLPWWLIGAVRYTRNHFPPPIFFLSLMDRLANHFL